mmetsp:Transcript_105405/g.187452  ORF Transcript_105405/g.187452 Transcript_105405/m.187452 type:complete len:955 (+) Transcript_105405:23-2887(+)
MSESIRVAIRVRPLNSSEGSVSAVSLSSSTPAVYVKALDNQIKTFAFDCCFSPSSGSQGKVYADFCSDLVASALDGYNSCLFAYGQTGAGKSYTMMGYGDDPGVTPRAVEKIFEQKEKIKASGRELRVWASFVEIYNEQIRDLLDPGGSKNPLPGGHPASLRVMDHPELGVILPGLVEAPCQTASEIRRLIKFGLKKRVVSVTVMNNSSSRSHAVFVIKVQQLTGRAEDGSQEATTARLNLVDLAGSERHKSAVSESATFREGCAINQSLSALALVIKELGEQQAARLQRSKSRENIEGAALSPQAVPFRSSKLTFVLRDSLAGNSRTRMIAAISPAACNVEETLSTLRFASSVKKVKIAASQNVERRSDVVQQLQAEVRRLKALLAGRGMEVGALGTSEMQEQIADRESLLQQMRKSYELQLEEAALLESTRSEVLQQQGLSSADIDEVFGMEKNTPHLINMSDDPSLSGCLMYFLPKGSTSIGSHTDNRIVLKGLGVPDFLCQIENQDQRRVSIRLTVQTESSHAGSLRINGHRLGADDDRELQHFDRLTFGRTCVMRLVVPFQHQDLASEKTKDKRKGLYEQDMLKLLIPDESEAWNELRLYFGDLRERLGEERSTKFFEHLSEASHMVDEANEITAELRKEDQLKFEVELVWDIHREVSDIIVIRFLHLQEDPVVLSYWTLGSFRQRLRMMRDCYDAFSRNGSWKGRGDPLQDPWIDPSTVELSLKMHASAEEELQREDLRSALLGSEEQSVQARPKTAGRSGAVPVASSQGSLRKGQGGSSKRSLLNGLGGATVSSEAGSVGSSSALRGITDRSVQHSASVTHGNGRSQSPPHSAPAADDQGEQTTFLLRQRLKDKESVEQVYKDRIAALTQELQAFQQEHGPLKDLLEGAASAGGVSPGCRWALGPEISARTRPQLRPGTVTLPVHPGYATAPAKYGHIPLQTRPLRA